MKNKINKKLTLKFFLRNVGKYLLYKDNYFMTDAESICITNRKKAFMFFKTQKNNFAKFYLHRYQNYEINEFPKHALKDKKWKIVLGKYLRDNL